MSDEPDDDPFEAAEEGGRLDGGDLADGDELNESVAAPVGPGTDEDPFEEMEVSGIDEEAVWTELGGDEGDAGDRDLDDLSAAIEVDGEADEAVVPKNQFCERCEYFSEPPEVSCGHDGTEIEEFVDVEHLRVVNCPVVENRARLERDE